MKRRAVLFMCIVFGLIFLSCNSNQPTEQTVSQSSCDGDASLESQFMEDAYRLTVRYLESSGDSRAGDVAIPDGEAASILDALLAVHNATDLPSRDTVAYRYHIHTWPMEALNGVFLSVDTAYSWTNAWASGTDLTGDPTIDNLMTTWSLSLVSYDVSPTGRSYVVLESADYIQVKNLAPAFAVIPGVISAGENSIVGDGEDIQVSKAGSDWILTYSYGWGDCPSGCIYRRHWDFRVSPECLVTFEGGYGDDI